MRNRVEMASKKSQVTFSPGKYGRSLNWLHAIVYVSSLEASAKNQIVCRLIQQAYERDDVELANRLLPVRLDSIANYDRDEQWERLSSSVRIERCRSGSHSTSPRYAREKLESDTLTSPLVSSGVVNAEIFRLDLFHLYSHLPYEGKVGYNVTVRRTNIGEYTQLALDNFSYHIILHQILYQGLVVTRALLKAMLTRSSEDVKLSMALLHCSSLADEIYPSLLIDAASNGLLNTVAFMLNCNTLPDQPGRSKLVTQLVIRCKSGESIQLNEEIEPEDRPRRVWLALVKLAAELAGDKEAERLRTYRIMTEEEMKERERIRLRAQAPVIELTPMSVLQDI